MASLLAPPPLAPEPSSNETLNDPSASSVDDLQESSETMGDDNRGQESPPQGNASAESDNAMHVDERSSTPAPTPNNRPPKRPRQNTVPVNDRTSTSPPPPNTPPPKRTRQNTKRNYQEADDEESNDESDEEMAPPPKSNKTNRQKSQATIQSSRATHELRLKVHKRRAVPVILGSRYMKVEVIDLTEIEVINAMSPLFCNLF